MVCNHGTGGLDPSVSDRVTEKINTFTKALEAATADPSHKALADLEDAADHLMRATGRVLIELGRLRAEQRHGDA